MEKETNRTLTDGLIDIMASMAEPVKAIHEPNGMDSDEASSSAETAKQTGMVSSSFLPVTPQWGPAD